MGQLSIGRNQHDFRPLVLILFFDLLYPIDDLHICCCRRVLFLVCEVHRHIAQDLSLAFRQNLLLHVSVNLVTELVVKEQLAPPSFSNEPAKPNLPFSLFFIFKTVVVLPEYLLSWEDVVAINQEKQLFMVELLEFVCV